MKLLFINILLLFCATLMSGCSGGSDPSEEIELKLKKVQKEPLKHSISVSVDNPEKGTVSLNENMVTHGSTALLTIIPQKGYSYTYEGCGLETNGENYETQEIKSACEIKVAFQEIVVDIISNTKEYGQLKLISKELEPLVKVSYSIETEEDYEVDSIDGCGGVLTNGKYVTSGLSESCSINVEFREKGRFMITFDDAFGEIWWNKGQPIFEQYNLKAVFYVNADLVLAKGEKHYIDKLYQSGHIIGHHSCSHQFVGSYEGDYMEGEIERCIDFYADYDLRHFSYPYGWAGGKRDVEKQLKERFDTVRHFSLGWAEGTVTTAEAPKPVDGTILKGDYELVFKLLERVKENGGIAHVATHKIVDSCEDAKSGWYICESELRSLIDYADSLGLLMGPPKDWF